MGALESGKSLAEQILAKLPESLRGQVSTAFAAPEATDALTLLGDTALARSDYSKHMDDLKKKEAELAELDTQLKTDYESLTTWWKTNEPKLKEYDTIKPEYDRLKTGGVPPPKDPPKEPAAGMTKEEVATLLQQRDEGYARVLAVTTTLASKHLRDFNEVLDVNALVEHATKNKLALFDPRAETDAYRAIHGEKVKAKADAEYKAQIEKDVQERLAQERKSQQQPFPVRGAEPSPLDLLNEPDRDKKHTADSALARYEELVAAAGHRT